MKSFYMSVFFKICLLNKSVRNGKIITNIWKLVSLIGQHFVLTSNIWNFIQLTCNSLSSLRKQALFQIPKLTLVLLKTLHLKTLIILPCFQNDKEPIILAKYFLSHDRFKTNQHLHLKKYFGERILTRSIASIPCLRGNNNKKETWTLIF